jgi:hypothetical protein
MPKQIRNLKRYLPNILEDAESALSPIARQAIYQLTLEHRSLYTKIIDRTGSAAHLPDLTASNC